MFRKLRAAIESAINALERPGQPSRENIDDLLAGMREELIETKARIPVLENQLDGLRKQHERELRSAEDCHRRALQAQPIGDDETVEVALRFEAKHRVAADVCVQKIEAAEAELAMQRQNATEMTEQLKAARAGRDALAIQARRAGATGSLRGGGRSAADEFDRMVDAIEREEDVGAAERALDRELGEASGRASGADDAFDDWAAGGAGRQPSRDELAELQLEELKRRIAEEKNRGD
jgi:phage shock protein A